MALRASARKGEKKRRGRPPLTPGEAKRSSFNTRLRTQLKEQLTDEAAKTGRSLSEEIEARLGESFLGEAAVRKRLEQEFGGPHNYSLAKTIAFLAGEIEQSTNARWTDDRPTFEQLEFAIQTVLKGVETPKAVVASASSRVAGPPAPKGRFRLGRAFALGLLDQVELAAAKGGQDSQHVSRLLRLASELAPALGPLLKRTPHMSGVRFVSGAVEVEPKARKKR